MHFLYSLARIACCALLLTACAGVVPLQRGQTAGLSKQATPAQVDAYVGQATITANHTFTSQGKAWDARHYNLQTGSTQQMTMVCAPTCMPVFYTVPVLDSYVLVFDSPARHLFAWGTLEELSRSPDDAVSAIMPDLKNSYFLALQAKKQN
jgi:hypothetical protein